jgi:DNA gyrase subunit A
VTDEQTPGGTPSDETPPGATSPAAPPEPTGQPAVQHGRIEQVDLQLEMQRSSLDYAMSVIVTRA